MCTRVGLCASLSMGRPELSSECPHIHSLHSELSDWLHCLASKLQGSFCFHDHLTNCWGAKHRCKTPLHLASVWGTGDPNSGLHPWAASTLPLSHVLRAPLRDVTFKIWLRITVNFLPTASYLVLELQSRTILPCLVYGLLILELKDFCVWYRNSTKLIRILSPTPFFETGSFTDL